MAVDLVVTSNKDVPEYRREYSLRFDDDGYYYYWFLYPLFEELCEQTDKMIDLYGDTRFETEYLSILKNTVEKAHTLVEQQPSKWMVHTGMQIRPVKKKIQKWVTKEGFHSRLGQLTKMVDYALMNDEHIVCLGD